MQKNDALDGVMDIKKYIDDISGLIRDLEEDAKKSVLNADIISRINKSCDGINYDIDRIGFAADQIGNSIGN